MALGKGRVHSGELVGVGNHPHAANQALGDVEHDGGDGDAPVRGNQAGLTIEVKLPYVGAIGSVPSDRDEEPGCPMSTA